MAVLSVTRRSTVLLLVLGTLGVAILSADVAVWASGSSVEGHECIAQGAGQAAEPIPVTITTSPRGDYRFLAPTAWNYPADPLDRTLEAFFVGPVDPVRRTVVMMSVSRYPPSARAHAMEQMISQLEGDKTQHILGAEPILVDRRPARLVRTHEVTSMLSKGIEGQSLDHRVSFVIVENGPDILVLGYDASPEVYEEYWPIFDRLVTSFQFVGAPR